MDSFYCFGRNETRDMIKSCFGFIFEAPQRQTDSNIKKNAKLKVILISLFLNRIFVCNKRVIGLKTYV